MKGTIENAVEFGADIVEFSPKGDYHRFKPVIRFYLEEVKIPIFYEGDPEEAARRELDKILARDVCIEEDVSELT